MFIFHFHLNHSLFNFYEKKSVLNPYIGLIMEEKVKRKKIDFMFSAKIAYFMVCVICSKLEF